MLKGALRGRWLGAALAVGLLGSIPYPVTAPVQWLCASATGDSGWAVSVARARWTPWGWIDLEDVRLQTQKGARLHVVRAKVRSVPVSLLLGHLLTQWRIGEIRMDPASWGIRRPLAQEILSAGPVTTTGAATVRLKGRGIFLEAFALQGDLLRAQGQGSWDGQGKIHLLLTGQLARSILIGMNLLKQDAMQAHRQGEPFLFQAVGSWNRPELLFASTFYRVRIQPRGEGGR